MSKSLVRVRIIQNLLFNLLFKIDALSQATLKMALIFVVKEIDNINFSLIKGINIWTLLYRKSCFLKKKSLMHLFFPAIDLFVFLPPASKHSFNHAYG